MKFTYRKRCAALAKGRAVLAEEYRVFKGVPLIAAGKTVGYKWSDLGVLPKRALDRLRKREPVVCVDNAYYNVSYPARKVGEDDAEFAAFHLNLIANAK